METTYNFLLKGLAHVQERFWNLISRCWILLLIVC